MPHPQDTLAPARLAWDTTRWEPRRHPETSSYARAPLALMMARGARCRCPSCGAAPLFAGYLCVMPSCGVCAAPLGAIHADDAPPYFTMFLVAHVIVLGMLSLERAAHPALWVHAALWLPLTALLTLALLRPVKGATVGLMLKLGLAVAEHDIAA